MTIREMNISARAKSCLMGAGYTEVDDIRNLSDEELLAIRNLNQRCVEEIRTALNEVSENADHNPEMDEDNNSEDISVGTKDITSSDLEMLKRRFAFVLTTLTEREQKVLILRYGLDGGRTHTLGEVGDEFGVTGERIRQIEAKSIRKLRHPSRFRKLRDYISEGADSLDVLKLLTGQDLTSVEPDEGYEISGINRDNTELVEGVEKRPVNDETPVDELELSIRSYNCLKRAGINTVGELCNKTLEDMYTVRNLGRRSLEEILAKLRELGLSLRESETEDIGINNSDKLNMPIYKMNLSVRSYNCLRRASIDIVRDLCARSSEDMMKVRNLGRKSLDEIIGRMDEIGVSFRGEDDDPYLYGYPQYIKDIAKEQGECWEHRLYIEIMILNYRWLSDFRGVKPVLWQKEYDNSTIDSNSKFKEFMSGKMNDLLGYTNEMSEAMNVKAAEAFGAPGESGDADKIISAALDFMETYRKWIRWKLEFEKVSAIRGYHRAIEALISVADGVLSGVDELYEKMLVAQKTFDDYLAGKISLDGVEIDLQVSFSAKSDELSNALAELADDDYEEEEENTVNEATLPEDVIFEDPVLTPEIKGDKSILMRPIRDIGLSNRTSRWLQRGGVDIVRDLCLKTSNDIRSLRLIGRMGIEEIFRKAKELGLSLYEGDELPFMYGYPQRVKNLAENHGREWQVRLYIEVLIFNFEWLSEYRNKKVVLWENDTAPIDSINELQDLSSGKIELIKSINEEFLKFANNPAESSDEHDIVRNAEGLVSTYKKWIRWCQSFIGIAAIPEFHELLEELYKIGEQAVSNFDRFYHKLVIARNKIDEWVENGDIIKGSEIDLQFSYNLSLDGFQRALDKLIAHSNGDEVASDDNAKEESE